MRFNRLFALPLALSAAASFAAACIELTLVRGDGNLETESRDHVDFDRVAIGSFADSLIVEGDDYGVDITCDENLLPYFETRVEDGTLHVEHPIDVLLQTDQSCGVQVTLPVASQLVNAGSGRMSADTALMGLTDVVNAGSGGVVLAGAHQDAALALSNTGSGDLVIDDVQANSVGLQNTGSGDVTLRGATDVLVIENTGSGSVDTTGLEAVDVDVTVTGSGDVDLHAGNSVEGAVTGSGSLSVAGEPADRDVVVSGSGDVVYR